MEEKIRQCTSFSEVAKVLGYDYYNGSVKKIVVKKCNELGIDVIKQIEEYKTRKVYCLTCHTEITGKSRFRKRFCSSSCAASYNNRQRGPKDEQEKIKISHSLLLHYGWSETEILNRDDDERGRRRQKLYIKECPVCHNQYRGRKTQKYCSVQCAANSPEVRQKLREKQLEKVANGTHCGWQSRNVTSYPEQFWGEVLDNNNIDYIREDFSTKKYFLDFLIERNGKKIDLEIDGGQHKRRKEHDEERDKFLVNAGYIVYRIPWKGVNTSKGKEYVNSEINKFLNFYKNL